MKFKCSRASDLIEEKPPCPEAVRDDDDHWHYWSVEINTLQDLLTFIDKYGKVIVETEYTVTNRDGKRIPRPANICIYDDYIE